ERARRGRSLRRVRVRVRIRVSGRNVDRGGYHESL
ncbi:MAG: hypothetical protein AVDCRST_MAG87-517, partial [uncultured Thermomicrobiales bacterium]